MSLNEMADAYHEQLLTSDRGLAYFSEQGVTRKGIEEFRLGWIDTPVRDYHESLVGHPVFPYITVDGIVIQVRFDAFEFDDTESWRGGVLDTHFPLEVPDVHLYNVRHALPGLRTNEVVMVQDLRSCIRVRQEGMRTVAAPGYVNFYEPWYELFRESNVTLVFNEQTREHGRRVMGELRRRGIHHAGVMLPHWGTVSDVMDGGSGIEQVFREHGVNLDAQDD